MNTLDKFTKGLQFETNIGFINKSLRTNKKGSSKAVQIQGELFSNDSQSLLYIINAKENEFLFI